MATTGRSKLLGAGTTCPVCGKQYKEQKSSFYISKSNLFLGNNSHMTICKSCLQSLYEAYCDLYGDIKKAIRHVCVLQDIYYDDNVAEYMKNISAVRFADYYRKVTSKKTYSDTVVEEQQAEINARAKEQIERKGNEQDKVEEEIDDDVIQFWGEGYNADEYRWLTNEYIDWKNRTGAKSKSEEELLKNVVFNEFQLQQAREANQPTDKLEQTFLNNLKAGGWSPNQNQADMSGLDSYGELIKKFEETKPIGEADEEFRDVDSMGDYITAFVTVPMAKSIGIKGVNSDAYDRLIEKYSVKDEVKKMSTEDEEAFDKALGNIGDM